MAWRLIKNKTFHIETTTPVTLYVVMLPMPSGESIHMETDATGIVVNWRDDGVPMAGGAQSTLVMSHARKCTAPSPVPLMLPPLTQVAQRAPTTPTHFAVFTGTIYVFGQGNYRSRLLKLHDPEHNVHVVGKCLKSDSEYLVNRRYCQRLRKRFDAYRDFPWHDSRYGLVPGGRQPMSYRLAETILANIIPVIIIPDDALLPPKIPWELISYRFSPDQEEEIIPFLRSVSDNEYYTMRQRLSEWEKDMTAESIFEKALRANHFDVR
tara:strand:+ start:996 stop:1793 length:798 start_codon:yes stop_codon:yes gene_type:complete